MAPIGSAHLERVDAQGIATNGAFVASEIRSTTSENCTGFDTPLSAESCKAAHLVMATAEGGSLLIKRPIPGLRSDRSASLSAGTFVAGQLLVDFSVAGMPSGGEFPWSASYPETKSGTVTVSVAADGRATFRFDDLAMAKLRAHRRLQAEGRARARLRPGRREDGAVSAEVGPGASVRGREGPETGPAQPIRRRSTKKIVRNRWRTSPICPRKPAPVLRPTALRTGTP
jgi:hypothetical protein